MPGFCCAERIIINVNLFITTIYFWGEVLSFPVTFYLGILMFSTNESLVHPYSVVEN